MKVIWAILMFATLASADWWESANVRRKLDNINLKVQRITFIFCLVLSNLPKVVQRFEQ